MKSERSAASAFYESQTTVGKRRDPPPEPERPNPVESRPKSSAEPNVGPTPPTLADHATDEEEVEDHSLAPSLLPGERCQTEPGGRLARVMFVGKIDALRAGYWVGVFYDEPVGKNDGSLLGKRYFRCPPGHGGFIRPNRCSGLKDVLRSEAEAEAAAARAETLARERKQQREVANQAKKGGKSVTKKIDSADKVMATSSEALASDAATDAASAAASTKQDAAVNNERDAGAAPAADEGSFKAQHAISMLKAAMEAARARKFNKEEVKHNMLTSKWNLLKKRVKETDHTRPAAAKCVVTGSGLPSAQVGALAQFTIIAHDADGRRILIGGASFAVTIRRRGSSTGAIVRAKVTDRDDGTYMVEYKPLLSGQYHIAISLGGEAIYGSPFSLAVVTLRPVPTMSLVRGKGLNAAVARRPQSFEVLFVDPMGHPAQVCIESALGWQLTLLGEVTRGDLCLYVSCA